MLWLSSSPPINLFGDCCLCLVLSGFQIMSPLKKEPLSSRFRWESMPAKGRESLWEAKSSCLAPVRRTFSVPRGWTGCCAPVLRFAQPKRNAQGLGVLRGQSSGRWFPCGVSHAAAAPLVSLPRACGAAAIPETRSAAGASCCPGAR